ncbi:MAG TPA: flagellar protein FlaG [bacterium]|nr:flagellar protein FlaG [bacterium]
MTPGSESPTYFSDLFERARRALVEHHAGTDAAALAPRAELDAPGAAGGVAAQLRIDDRTREVVVRFYDLHTGATIREVPSAQVAAAAARLRTATG